MLHLRSRRSNFLHNLSRATSFFAILSLLLPYRSHAQFFTKEYELVISKASHHLSKNEYERATTLYDSALHIMQGKYPLAFRYLQAAKAHAMNGEVDNAFFYLRNYLDKGWIDAKALINEPMLMTLHGNKGWDQLLEDLSKKNAEYSKVRQEIEQLGFYDQVLRKIENCMGQDSAERAYFYLLQRVQDAENLKKVDSILEVHGWLGMSKIGDKASSILSRIVLHSSVEDRERYLPVIEASVQAGESSPQDFAILVDKILLGENQKQRYGTQFMEIDGRNQVLTIEDPETLENRRKALGLSSIHDYLQFCGIENVTIETLSDTSTLSYFIESRWNE